MKRISSARRTGLTRPFSIRSFTAGMALLLTVIFLPFGDGSVGAAGRMDSGAGGAESIIGVFDTIPVFQTTGGSAREPWGGRVVRVVAVSGAPDTDVNVAIEVDSQGGETAISFSLNFDPTKLSITTISGTNNNPDVMSGSDAPFSTRTVNMSQAASGRIGLLQTFNGSLSAGTRQILVFRFRILPAAAQGATAITFGDVPVLRSMTNEQAQALDATYTGGNVTITGPMPGTLQFGSPSVTVGEGDGNAVFAVTRTGGSSGAVSVQYAATDQSATGAAACSAGVDYVTTAGTLNFASGQTSNTITVPVCNDSVFEPNESALVTLSSPTGGATIGTPGSATLFITDDDPLPTVSVSVAPASVAEDGAANLVYTFTRSDGGGAAMSVNFSVTGSAASAADYDLTGASLNGGSGVVNFTGGATATVVVDPAADLLVEPDETVILTVTPGAGYSVGNPDSATGTITNDDVLPTVTLSVSPASVTEDGSANFVYTFTRSGPAGDTMTAFFTIGGTATSGSDYSCLPGNGSIGFACSSMSGEITFAPGSATAELIVDPTEDALVEGDETVILTVTPGAAYTVGTPSSATGMIVDFTSVGLEGDVAERPSGDGLLRSNDVEAVRALIAGEPVSPFSNEFQRADVAPYETRGDGLLLANDLQLVKNYVAALVEPQPAGGPSAAVGAAPIAEKNEAERQNGRTVRLVSGKASTGAQVTVSVEIDSLGDEVVSLFSLGFDSSMLSNPVVTPGDGVTAGTTLTTNTQMAKDGRITILIDSSSAFLWGTSARIVNITFDVAKDAPLGETPITFDDSGSISDAAGKSLEANYDDGSVIIIGRARMQGGKLKFGL